MAKNVYSSPYFILWVYIFNSKKKQLFLLFGLMTLTTIAEAISIGSIFPFLGLLTSPNEVFSHPLAQPFISFFNLKKPHDLLFAMALLFGTAAIISGFLRVYAMWMQTRIAVAIGSELSLSVYKQALNRPYQDHLSLNSSEIHAATTKALQLVGNFLQPSLTIVASFVMLIGVLGTVFFIDIVTTVFVFIFFGSIYFIFVYASRKRMQKYSQIIADNTSALTKAMQEGLGGIRHVILDNTYESYIGIYRDALIPLQRAGANLHILSLAPRYVLEAFGVAFIAGVALVASYNDIGLTLAIPMLGVLAFSAQRLLPVLQQIYSSVVALRGARCSIIDTLYFLKKPLLRSVDYGSEIEFRKYVELRNVDFSYDSNSRGLILNDVSLRIPKGSYVGIVGPTGSGKTTFVDLFMGLLMPTRGSLLVDGTHINANNCSGWQRHIAHVSQSIFLADTSIKENIALGSFGDDIDFERVKQAAKKAALSEVIEAWPDKYDTRVGELGVALSGGQRQRVAIARAFYKRSNMIILDEATSALDGETEEAVMDAIDCFGDDITLVIIAHRTSTLKHCDFIVKISEGRISKIGSYAELSKFDL